MIAARMFGILFIIFLAVSALSLIDKDPNKAPNGEMETLVIENSVLDKDDERWKLILVNRTHPIPDDYEVHLMTLDNGEQIDERIYPELQAMFDAARADGLQLFVAAGYRTGERQQQLMEEEIQSFLDEGYDSTEAERLAKEWVALPGTSEHQLGLAVDINADVRVTSSERMYEWLSEHSAAYGFIRRYPADKTEITGIRNEPWHYRYVGKEAAGEIASRGICLEEFLEKPI